MSRLLPNECISIAPQNPVLVALWHCYSTTVNNPTDTSVKNVFISAEILYFFYSPISVSSLESVELHLHLFHVPYG